MKLPGLMELGKRELVGMADELMLHAEADKCADAIHAIGKGEVPYVEEEWNALIARFEVLVAAMDREPGECSEQVAN